MANSKRKKNSSTAMHSAEKNLKATYVIIVISIITLICIIPKPNLDIFFDPEFNHSTFVVSNLGNKPVTGVKVSYELDCQRIAKETKYIDLEIPSLTESNGINPRYIHFFDDKVKSILENYVKHRSECDDISDAHYFLSQEEIEKNIDKGKFQANFTTWMCDPCILNIEVASDQQAVREQFDLYNLMELTFEINCIPDQIEDCRDDCEFGYCCKVKSFQCGVKMYNSNNMLDAFAGEKLFHMRNVEDGIEYRFKRT